MNLIYPRSAKNQACFEEKNEKIGLPQRVPFEKVNARGGIKQGAFSLTKRRSAFSMTKNERAFSLTKDFPKRRQFIEMWH